MGIIFGKRRGAGRRGKFRRCLQTSFSHLWCVAEAQSQDPLANEKKRRSESHEEGWGQEGGRWTEGKERQYFQCQTRADRKEPLQTKETRRKTKEQCWMIWPPKERQRLGFGRSLQVGQIRSLTKEEVTDKAVALGSFAPCSCFVSCALCLVPGRTCRLRMLQDSRQPSPVHKEGSCDCRGRWCEQDKRSAAVGFSQQFWAV